MVFFILVGDDNIADIGEQVAANLLSSIAFVGLDKVEPVFLRPSDICTKQYAPKGIIKLVLALSSSLIYISGDILKKSRSDMTLQPTMESTILSILGKGSRPWDKLYLVL